MYIYHAIRMGEGKDTQLDPDTKEETSASRVMKK